MIITFFGHSNYAEKSGHRQKILDYIESVANDEPIEFYLGGYGNFDGFALSCAKEYQKTHPNTKTCFVTPYLDPTYEKTHLKYNAKIYDEIIYPPIEKAHPKYAISYRNKWMAERADIVIAYVARQSGGAFSSLQHSKKLGKTYFNAAEYFFDASE